MRSLCEKIRIIYPELEMSDFLPWGRNQISIQNDSDGKGDYIKEWNYHKPQPTQEQLDALDD